MMILSTLLNHSGAAYLACFRRRSTGLILHLRPCLRRDGTAGVVLRHIVLCEFGRDSFVTLSQLMSAYCSADYCKHKPSCLRDIGTLYTLNKSSRIPSRSLLL